MIAMVNMAERKFERSFCKISSRKDFCSTNARTFERHVSTSSRTNCSDRDRALPMSCQVLFPCGKAKTFSCPEDKIKFSNLMSSKTPNFRILLHSTGVAPEGDTGVEGDVGKPAFHLTLRKRKGKILTKHNESENERIDNQQR